MAHAVAPIPSLAALREDCPEELDEIFRHVLAKEPEGRFATPGELADAVGPLADAEELSAISRGTRPGQRGVVSDPAIKSSHVDTREKVSKRSGQKVRLSGVRRPRVPWYSGTWAKVAAALGAVAIVVLGVWLANGLRRFLDQFDLSPNYTDRHRRETQELQLLAAELLIGSEPAPGPVQVVRRDVDYLDRLLPAFRWPDQMLPYLRRYYDLAIRAIGTSDLKRVARYVLASRAEKGQDRLRQPNLTLLVFHFTQQEGMAILIPPDGPGTPVKLDFGRKRIKESASRRTADLALDAKLVELVKAEVQKKRAIDVSWSDEMCWPSPQQGLSDKDWPFANLDLAALRKGP